MSCLLDLKLWYFLSLLLKNLLCDSEFKVPLYSTKTPYFWLKNIEENVPEDEQTWVDFENKECQIMHLNLILRHGSRSPTLSWVKKMNAFGNILKSNHEVVARYPFIKLWQNGFPESKAGHLSDLGEDEQFQLGWRFGRRFNLLLDGDLDSIYYGVTYKQRTQASCESFYEGLTDAIEGEGQTDVKHHNNDKHLRFFDSCTKYANTVENNKTSAPEHSSFKNGQDMQKIADKLANKLGLKTLNIEEAQVIHHLCVFELATFDKSDWCQLLEKEDLLLFEYMYDLKQYWRRGYGHSVNWQMTCPYMKNLLTVLDDVISKAQKGEDFSVSHIQFGHAETLIPLYAALGLFNDSVPLRADNYASQTNRLFRTSKIVPMSANLGIGLYHCEADEKPNDSYVIRMFVNEEPVVIPACGNPTCTYEDFVEFYKKFLDCDYTEICENHSSHDEL